MSGTAAKRCCLAVALVLVTTSCGYTLTGFGASVIPESVSVIAVTAFENRTRRPEIEQRVTEEVVRELSRRGRTKAGRLQITTKVAEADAVLEGAITRYQTRSVAFATNGRAIRVETEVLIQATLRERATDRVLWSQSGLIFKEQFDVPPSGEFFDQETLALDAIALGAAAVLVASIVEGF